MNICTYIHIPAQDIPVWYRYWRDLPRAP